MPEDPAVTRFREYLRIRTDHPKPNYDAAVDFLKKQAKRIGLPVLVHGTSAKPVVVITWNGQNASLPAVMVNSHMDVVPVYPEKWSHDPFEAHKTDDGKIYGRGTQDMKSQGMQYIESVSTLLKQGFKPIRTVHIVFVPDEEIGSTEGMAAYVKSEEFQSLNVGFAVDEACACPLDFFILFFDERSGWALEITCTGPAGHGSLMLPNTAGEKARIIMDEFFDRRNQEDQKLAEKPFRELELANVTTINLTMISGGVQCNVIPDSIKLTFDIRVSVLEDHNEFFQWIQSAVKKAGEGVEVNFIRREPKIEPTKTDDSNPFWIALKEALEKTGIDVVPVACPGNTDGRYLRGVGVPTFGFSAMRNTPVLLHGHDEYLAEQTFLEGINVFVEVIKSLSSVP